MLPLSLKRRETLEPRRWFEKEMDRFFRPFLENMPEEMRKWLPQ